jgi:phage-related baseplate assembly protein
MATLDLKGLPRLLADQAAAAQASAGRALNYTPGSILRALAEGFAALGLWLQAQVLKVLGMTRLRTSVGEDVDSFVEDFGLSRTQARPAAGEVTLSRFVTGAAAFAPVGALVRTADGSVTFAVTADPANAAYDAGAGGYWIGALVGSLNVPVQAVTTGPAGNVDPGTVTLLATPISGVDTVNNASAMTGGVAAQSDAALQAQFPLYLASLSKATSGAIDFAISQVQAGILWRKIEGEDAAGAPRQAHFVVVVDDGSGSPPISFLNLVYAAVDPVRGLGISFEVVAAETLGADVSMSLATAAGANHAAAVAAAAAAIGTYLGNLDIGETLPFTRLAQIAYAASPAVTNVSAVTLNGGTADLVPSQRQRVIAGTVAVA